MFDLLTVCFALYVNGALGPARSECVDIVVPDVVNIITKCKADGPMRCLVTSDDHNRLWFHMWSKPKVTPVAPKVRLPKQGEV